MPAAAHTLCDFIHLLASVALRDMYSKSPPNYIAGDVSLAPENSHINRRDAIVLDPCIFAKRLG